MEKYFEALSKAKQEGLTVEQFQDVWAKEGKTKEQEQRLARLEENELQRRLPPDQNQPGAAAVGDISNSKKEDATWRQHIDTALGLAAPSSRSTQGVGPIPPRAPDYLNKKYSVPSLKSNQYQVRKSAARSLMDVALMMANISQLRTTITLGEEGTSHYHLLLILISFSLGCQVIFAIFMFILLMRESEMAQRKDYLDHLNMLESNGLSKEDSDNLKMKVANNREDLRYDVITARVNYVTMFLVFLITVVNMLITGFS